MAILRTSQGHEITLPAGRVSVGESPANELPVARGLGLGGVHFHMQPWEGGHFLEDAGSGLGTLVNDRKVSWVPLQNGDIITAGELRVTYIKDPAAPVPAIPVFAESITLDTSPVPVTEPQPAAEASRHLQLPAPPPQPPSWLPPEALEPPSPPPAWDPQELTGETGKRRPGVQTLLVCALLLAAGAAVFYILRGRG